jgi:hypothetical protein
VKCHQRKIREAAALTEIDDPEALEAAKDIKNAVVREIDRKTAESVILKYEWLGNMGNSARYFGIYFKHPTTGSEYLAGVNCFGHPGSISINQICGKEHVEKIYWLARGACVHFAHPHAGSLLTTEACKLFGKPWKTRDGKDMPAKFVFVATADSDAGECGTIYQACNWFYVGKTTSDRMFLKDGMPKELAKSYRVLVKGPLRNRTGRVETADPDGRRHFLIDGEKYYCGDTLPDGCNLVGSPAYPFKVKAKYGKTMKEAEANRLKEILAEGWKPIPGNPKYMYCGIYSDGTIKGKKQRKELIEALKNHKMKGKDFLPYPKRKDAAKHTGVTADMLSNESTAEGGVQVPEAAPSL